MARLLEASGGSRLHLALVLVGREKVPAEVVLDLRWSQVDTDRCRLVTAAGVFPVSRGVGELFFWHRALQRLDAWRCPRWPQSGRVFVNQHGAPITGEVADAQLRHFCTLAGVPVVPLSGLRHPSWSR